MIGSIGNGLASRLEGVFSPGFLFRENILAEG
jgi:hypothetical protein